MTVRWMRTEVLPLHAVKRKVAANEYETHCGIVRRPILVADRSVEHLPKCSACSEAIKEVPSDHGIPVEEPDDR